MDEVYVRDMAPAVNREFTDVPDGGVIPCRYNDIIIPGGVPRIFLSNDSMPFYDPAGSVINRRLVVLRFDHWVPGPQEWPADYVPAPIQLITDRELARREQERLHALEVLANLPPPPPPGRPPAGMRQPPPPPPEEDRRVRIRIADHIDAFVGQPPPPPPQDVSMNSAVSYFGDEPAPEPEPSGGASSSHSPMLPIVIDDENDIEPEIEDDLEADIMWY